LSWKGGADHEFVLSAPARERTRAVASLCERDYFVGNEHRPIHNMVERGEPLHIFALGSYFVLVGPPARVSGMPTPGGGGGGGGGGAEAGRGALLGCGASVLTLPSA
jgi:hypothetical protein